MTNKNIITLTQAASIAAIYTVLTLAANSLSLANGAIQVRFSEMLTVLPYFTPAAVPGLFAGCLLSNLLTGCAPMDVVFGSLATLLGAWGSYMLRRSKWLVPLPPIAANTLIVPFILAYVYRFEGSIPYFMLTVGVGEALSCGLLGLLFLKAMEKPAAYLFPSPASREGGRRSDR